MAINPTIENERARLGRSAEYAMSELTRFNCMRRNTVNAYLGVSQTDVDWDWDWTHDGRNREYEESLPKGNLLQLSALGMQIGLAYGEPQYFTQARQPDHVGTAESMEAALNRMSLLLNLGETARQVAADSYFGYGIFKVGVGIMPLSAQAATGMQIGPCVWRVSQPNFLYDITVADFDDCAFMGDFYSVPLNEAQELYPRHADRLAEMTDADRVDAARVLARPSRFYTPEPMVQLFDWFLPGTKVVNTSVIRGQNIRSISEEPLAIRDFNGHWSGIYGILNHLYSPDDLVPIAQAESVKALHFLFNDILALTSEQARKAKVNPIYQSAAEKDMKKLWDAADRVPVAVVDPTRFGQWEVPGPTQSQTAYMSAMLALFKQMSFNLDAQLGLGNLGSTATESSIVSEKSGAMIAEARRKFLRVMQLVGYKLGHLLMNDQNLMLPLYRPLVAGSNIQVDISHYPPSRSPRKATVDDFDVGVESYSLKYREPEQRLQQIATISNQIIMPAVIAEAQGMPISAANVIKTAAKYSGNPELNDWYEPVDPMYQQKKQASFPSAQRAGVGHYVRENVSEKNNDGVLSEALTQMAGANGEGTRIE